MLQSLISTLILLLHGVPRIHFYDGDDCHELAKNFCQKYGLEKGLADLLEPWLQIKRTPSSKDNWGNHYPGL